MAPLGIASGVMLTNVMSSATAAVVSATGTAVRVTRGDTSWNQGLFFEPDSITNTTFRSNFSIAFWIKIDDGQPATQQIMCGQKGAADSNILLSVETDGKIMFTFTANSDIHQNKTNAAVFADGDNAYKHIGVSMQKTGDGTVSVSEIFVDGEKLATTRVGSGDIDGANHGQWAHESDVFGIGVAGTSRETGAGGETGYGTAGDINSFAIWNSLLIEDEFVAIYNAGSDPNHVELLLDIGNYDSFDDVIAYFKLNDYSGSIASNSKTDTVHDAYLLGNSVFV